MKKPQRILIVGGTSAIAEAMARRFVARGDHVCLAARNTTKLDIIAKDLRIRAPKCFVNCLHFDASIAEDQTKCQEALLILAEKAMGSIDVILIAHGTLPDPVVCASSPIATLEAVQVNGMSTISLMAIAAQRFQAQQRGTIAVITSVAGDRGRGSNYVYGSAKALVTAFASGLGQKLRNSGIRVVNIKPGFVDTPMTASFKKGALWASADAVAKRAVRGIDAGSSVVYAPGFWAFIMLAIKTIPERIFQRLPL